MEKYLIRMVLVICLAGLPLGANEDIHIVERPNTELTNNFYLGNLLPLRPSAFMKLPIGAIKPEGWLLKQLELEGEGFTGRLPELSYWARAEGNPWLYPDRSPLDQDMSKNQGFWGELTPMWLRAFSNLGYVLGDERIIREARTWIEGVISTQLKNGYFGPRRNLNDTRDLPFEFDRRPNISYLWPNMPMLNVFQSYYEYSGDDRILGVMSKYFRWQMTIPDEDFLSTFWQNMRGGDNLESVYWLYNRTGEGWLLDLAQKIHRNTGDWTRGLATWHGFDIAKCFIEPAVFYQQSKEAAHLEAAERNYQTAMSIYGQVPGGLFVSDENSWPGFTGPEVSSETCMIVLMMNSHETMLKMTGDSKWADRCEEVAFNSLPASMTADLKATYYFGATNMVVINNFSPHSHYCCLHNVGMGWPYYAQHLLLATPDNGLAAVLYAPCQVTASVGDGTKVNIQEKTRYPFDENIELTVATAKPVQFPLYLRVPGWCENPKLAVNDKAVVVGARPGSYIVIDRKWSDGDTVSLELPMKIKVKTWTRNKNSVSVNRGPLTYSLKIGEEYIKLPDGGRREWWSIGDTNKWPAWKVHPTTPWNYGLLLNEKDPEASFEVVKKPWPESGQPFDAKVPPVELHVKAKRIPAWHLDSEAWAWQRDSEGRVQPLQLSPIRSDEPTEIITLIPMGAARLRLSAFPTIGTGPDAREWKEIFPTATASHTEPTYYGIRIPQYSDDGHIFPGFSWWDRKGSKEWVQYDFAKTRTISTVEIYWYEYDIRVPIRVPENWRLLYKQDGQWKEVPNPSGYGVENGYNRVTFDPVEADGLRIEVKLQKGFSGGIVEWRLK